MFEKSGDIYKFVKYGKLYPPMAWAELKFISLNREELALGMLKWSKTPIHDPLTQMPKMTPEEKKRRDLATDMFKNIMGYMGDRKYDAPNQLAAELLSHCLASHDLRTECFCQLIKQLTANPDPHSSSRGWDLMILMLSTYPPPADFENFLEMYLRTCSSPKDKFVNQLHDTLYGGERKVAPSVDEFAQILANANANSAPRTRDEAAGMAPVQPAPKPNFNKPRPMGSASMPPRGGGMMGTNNGSYGNNTGTGSYGMNSGSGSYGNNNNGYMNNTTGSYNNSGGMMGGSMTASQGMGGGGGGIGIRGGPPRGGPPRGAPPRGAPSASEPEDTATEWHFIDKNGGQNGPVLARDVKGMWRNGQVDGECIAWNPDLPNWIRIAELPDFMRYLSS